MTQILTETHLDYSDILIKPKMGNNLNSRKEVNLIREYKFKRNQVRRGLNLYSLIRFTSLREFKLLPIFGLISISE